MKIGLKLLIIIVITIMVVAFIIGVTTLSHARSALEETAIRKVSALADHMATTFNQEFKAVETTAIDLELIILSLIDKNKVGQKGYLDDFELILEPIVYELALLGDRTQSAYVFFDPSLDGDVHDVWYTDLYYTGQVTRQEEFDMSFYNNLGENDKWYSEPKRTMEPYWTQPYLGSIYYDEDITYVSHTRPLIIDEKFYGIVGSDYHYNLMRETIINFSLYDSGYAILQNEVGEIIIHPTLEVGSSLLDVAEEKYAWMIDEMVGNEYGLIEYIWLDNEDKFMVYRKLINGWIFSIAISKEEVFGEIQNMMFYIVVIVGVVLLALSCLIFILSRQITKPLEELDKQVEGLEQGKYDNVIPDNLIKGKSEISKLSNGIEVLRQSIKYSLDEVNTYGQTLESEVKKRTLALLDSHQDLEDALIMNQEQNDKLLEINSQLNQVFDQLEATHRQIIEAEKIASINAMMTKIATEFDEPLKNFNDAIQLLYEEKKNIDEKLAKNELRMFELDQFFSIYELKATGILKQLDYMKGLLERFKALDPYTSTLKTSFNMSEMIQIVIDGIHLRTDVHVTILCDKGLVVDSDAAKISQILYQLIVNANEHAFKGIHKGMIVVDVSYSDQLYISVKDNGVGIDQSIKSNLFNLVEASNTSGYGLNIVTNIVEKVFQGEIRCISEEGQGTEFIISIGI